MQHNEINRGRCGECGDEWSLPRPRPNEEGGRYGNSIISHTYSQGQVKMLFFPKYIIMKIVFNWGLFVTVGPVGSGADCSSSRLLRVPSLPKKVCRRVGYARMSRWQLTKTWRRVHSLSDYWQRSGQLLPKGPAALRYCLRQLCHSVDLHIRYFIDHFYRK